MLLVKASLACALSATACVLCSGVTKTSLSDMGSKIDEGTDEAGEEPGDEGSDDEDEWFIVWSRWPAQIRS